MMGWLSSKCTCVKGRRRAVVNDEYSESDSKSVSEIELKASSEPMKKIGGKRNNCCKLKRHIPRTILKWFGQDDEMSMTKIEKTIKASLLIQKWYRRYMARLEVRRRYTWTIFQTLEYAGEQDQVKLYNFFNALLTHIPQSDREYDSTETSRNSSFENLNLEFDDESPDEDYYDPEEKRKLLHFSIEYPYTEKTILQLIEIFRKHRHFRLHPKNLADILKRAITTLKKLPNINIASTSISKQLTICGDLHGKFDDLLVILHKNGLPSAENPYVFNGDYIDRGKRGLEVFLILLLCLLAIPGAVYLNRGNHEDIIMNQRYGFIREVQSKYRKNHEKLLKLIEGVYRYLPLGTIVNNKVLIVHGGISDSTDMEMIRSLDRGKYASLLRPPLSDSTAPGSEVINKVEWKQPLVAMMSASSEDVLIAAAACVVICGANKERAKRRFWVRPSLEARKKYSGSDLLQDLQRDDKDLLAGELRTDGSFKNFVRMTSTDFGYLLLRIGGRIEKKNTAFRDAIPIKERLAVTLRFLASGDSYRSLSYLFKISTSSICKIVPDVCGALVDTLQDFIKTPSSAGEWLHIAEGFERKCNFPLCLGSIDGKHIELQAPIGSSSEYFNYKGFHSIILMVFDILWSDPQEAKGCVPNSLRGAGTYFGPDVTKKFLEQNRLMYIIRSHECKPEGYEVCHNNSVITIFSASNYYEVGSNNGAYLKLVGPELDTHYVQYMANSGKKKLNFFQRMGLVESGAAKELKMQIMTNKSKIEQAFAKADSENTGYISITEWCVSLENATGLQIPWRMLKDKLVTIDPDTNKVKYQTTFDIKSDKLNSVQGASTVVETLYRNKSSLEAIFRIIDKDNSGFISLDEFSEACNLIKKHMPCPMTTEQLEEICKLMDLNKDGLVDLNEFLESFRMVDPESRMKNHPGSPETTHEDISSRPTKHLQVSASTEESEGPMLSPALIKPLNLPMKNIEEKKLTNNTEQNIEDKADSVKVIVHNAPKQETNNQVIPVKHLNTLQLSPVLSSRRGSQI